MTEKEEKPANATDAEAKSEKDDKKKKGDGKDEPPELVRQPSLPFVQSRSSRCRDLTHITAFDTSLRRSWGRVGCVLAWTPYHAQRYSTQERS